MRFQHWCAECGERHGSRHIPEQIAALEALMAMPRPPMPHVPAWRLWFLRRRVQRGESPWDIGMLRGYRNLTPNQIRELGGASA